MNSQVIKKFVKGAVSGGIIAVGAVFATGVNIQNLGDLKTFLIVLLSAFVGGAIHAIIEMMYPTVPADVTSVVTTATPK